MRKVEFKKSFDRTYKKLAPDAQVKIDECINNFLAALEQNRLSTGLGLKRLRGDLWEIRADLSLRVAFRIQKDRIEFGMTGTHDAIRRFLKTEL